MTNPIIVIPIVILLSVLAGVALERLRRDWQDMQHEIKELREHSQTRHTHETLDGLDDEQATDIQEWFIIRDSLERLEWINQKRQAIRADIRQGPHAYDVDQPSGMRPGKKAK